MEPAFWHKRWSENRIEFHQQEFNSRLTAFWPSLGIPPGACIFIPLCGKSLDMLWLVEQGYRVLGIELSQVACEAFFVENDLAFEVREQRPFKAFAGQGITLLAGDFFDLFAADLAHVGGFYDRASLIAFPQQMRNRYAGHLAATLPAGCQGLLVSMSYDEAKMEGPPFSVASDEVYRIFRSGFSVDLLAEYPGLKAPGRLQKRGLDILDEKVYRIAVAEVGPAG